MTSADRPVQTKEACNHARERQRDLATARAGSRTGRAFHAEKLGLEPAEERPAVDGTNARAGSSGCSSGAPAGLHTQAAWGVDDIEASVTELRARGVVFEQYDGPGLTTVGGVAEIPDNYPSKGVCERAAWFKDSEGNLLSIGQPILRS